MRVGDESQGKGVGVGVGGWGVVSDLIWTPCIRLNAPPPPGAGLKKMGGGMTLAILFIYYKKA